MPLLLHAQVPQKTQGFVINPQDNVVQLDIYTIASSITVTHADTTISKTFYSFNENTSKLTFHWPSFWTSLPVEIVVTWQYYPISLSRTFRLFDPVVVKDTTSGLPDDGQVIVRSRSTGPTFTGDSNLKSSGSITRGVIVGTNQDFGLESGLRFDLQGYITDDVYLTASLSDQNTLIQPDGTTQNLREFDQVFIRMTAPNTSLQLGDVDVDLRKSSIARLNRRLQGAEGTYRYHDSGTFTGAAAVVRGTFRVMEFNARDGVQGPYRLTGNNNEPFIIVVAGTERVYLDGRLLVRGEDNDYIIDYSLGEINFTNRRLMRDTHRIRVEYQYLSNNYNRTLLATETDYSDVANGRIQIGATFIREADNINFDDAFGLTAEEIEILRNAGSNRELMRSDGADSVGFRSDVSFILYARVDTLFQGQTYSIFKNIPGDSRGVYRVQFTRVDSGAGSYIRSGRSVNGILYEWVGPGNGNYEPFRQLDAPQSRQMLAIRTKADISQNLNYYGEWALSSVDANRYSRDITTSHDHSFINSVQLRESDIYIGNLNLMFSHEYKGGDFEFFDRVRDVEFNRLWDIRDGGSAEEHRLAFLGDVNFSSATSTSYKLQSLLRPTQTGVRHDFEITSNEEGLPFLNTYGGFLTSENTFLNTKTQWENVDGSLGYNLNFLGMEVVPQYGFNAERRKERDLLNDELSPNSFAHSEHIPALALQLTERTQLIAAYAIREEFEPVEGDLVRSSVLTSPETEIRFSVSNFWSGTSRVAYRNRVYEPFFKEQRGREDVSGIVIRSSNDIRLLNRTIDMALLYDVTSESRAILQETYLEVGPEFGQYVWIDLNGDGVQQIDEFFPEQTPNEGTFIRQLLPSDDLIPVISLNARWRLRIDPIHAFPDWRNRSEFVQFLANTVYTSVFDVREQNETVDIDDIYLLRLGTFRNPSSTINGRLSWNQELQLFRRLPQIDLRLMRDYSEQLSRQAAGLEESKSEESEIFATYRFPRSLVLSGAFRYIDRRNISSEITSRNYDITGWQVEPKIRVLFTNGVQSGVSVNYGIKNDSFGVDGARLNYGKITHDSVIHISDNIQMNYRLEYRDMNISGTSSPLGIFELTDGAGEGQSWLWGGQLNWRTSDWVRASLRYDGRTVRNAPNIQTFRFTVSATF